MPKIADHSDRMRAIASAAIGVIGEAGIHNTRLRDVARAADVTTGAVTHYFDGKDAVLEAALAEVVRRLIEAQRSARVVDGDVAGAVAAFMPNTEERRRDWKVWFAFWGRAISDARLRRQHRAYYAAILANLTDSIRAFQRSGLAHPAADPALLADAVVAAVDGLGIRASLEPDEWPPERQRKTLRAMLEPILRAPPPI
ncbi:MAG: TetR family transcriptional regulator C-terminal domain-containing protein [Alphaproteobacteria bacterium]|nr:TetR family transcriptional regulator C-terminal domain-containing protein [Alphaproteobacteria bacterium]